MVGLRSVLASAVQAWAGIFRLSPSILPQDLEMDSGYLRINE
jgi:hypothetical protein